MGDRVEVTIVTDQPATVEALLFAENKEEIPGGSVLTCPECDGAAAEELDELANRHISFEAWWNAGIGYPAGCRVSHAGESAELATAGDLPGIEVDLWTGEPSPQGRGEARRWAAIYRALPWIRLRHDRQKERHV